MVMAFEFPHWRGWPLLQNPIRVEEYADGRRWVVRAQLPGAEPDRDITVMVADNEVTIDVRRPIPLPGRLDSEFGDSRVRRTIMLPRGAKDETLTAMYGDDGILELRVETVRPVPIGRTVPVARQPTIRKTG
jgi:HSP20 family protein